MRQLTVALAVLIVGTSEARAFDCPNTGDACPVSSSQDQWNFNLPLFGLFSDNVVMGQVDLLFGKTLAACVNGDLQFDAFQIRDKQARDAVVCLGPGNDTVKVLAAGETFSCNLLGLPIILRAWQYNGFELALYGQSGADTITGADGKDQICGGTGNDKLFGRNEVNEINGGPGNDDITGGPDIDYLFGADGDDIIIDTGTGGFRNVCAISPFPILPSRVEGGSGNDCLQIPTDTEPGWCYGQEEACGAIYGNVCHGGLFCAAGTDRINNNRTIYGAECEVRTTNRPCTR